MNDRKEQRPDTRSDGKAESKIRLDDPSYVFREFSNESAVKDKNRVGRFKDRYGYEVVSQTETRTIMACPKEEHDKRQQAYREKSEGYLRQNNSGADNELKEAKNTFEYVQGLPSDD